MPNPTAHLCTDSHSSAGCSGGTMKLSPDFSTQSHKRSSCSLWICLHSPASSGGSSGEPPGSRHRGASPQRPDLSSWVPFIMIADPPTSILQMVWNLQTNMILSSHQVTILPSPITFIGFSFAIQAALVFILRERLGLAFHAGSFLLGHPYIS